VEVAAKTESADGIPKASLPKGVVLCQRSVALLISSCDYLQE